MSNLTVLEQLTKLPTKVKIGQKVSSDPINKFSASKGQTHVISFLDDASTPFRLHYVKKAGDEGKDIHMGSIHCHNGECCLREGKPNLYMAIPVLEYTVIGKNDKGQTTYGKPYSFKYMLVKKGVWDSKIASLLESGDPTDTDFTIILTPGKEQFQDMIINSRKNDCVWRQDEQIVNERQSLINFFDNVIEGLVAKHVTDEDIVTFYEGDEDQRALKASTPVVRSHAVAPAPVAAYIAPTSTPIQMSTGEEVDLDDFINA